MTDPWKCSWCGAVYVVPELARCCEDKHLNETQPVERA